MRESAGNDDRLKQHLSKADVKELFLEFNCSKQCSTGNGELFIHGFAEGVPAWFAAAELGLAIDCSPSIVTTVYGSPDQPELRAFNRSARKQARDEENDRIHAFNAEAKAKGVKSYARPVEAAHGCVGCVSCVPDARLRPARPLSAPRLAAWTPSDPNVLGRHATATVERQRRTEREKTWRDQKHRLTRGASDLRRLDRDKVKAEALKQRQERAAAARDQMQKRRDEQKAMRAVARRSGVKVQRNRLQRDDKPHGQ